MKKEKHAWEVGKKIVSSKENVVRQDIRNKIIEKIVAARKKLEKKETITDSELSYLESIEENLKEMQLFDDANQMHKMSYFIERALEELNVQADRNNPEGISFFIEEVDSFARQVGSGDKEYKDDNYMDMRAKLLDKQSDKYRLEAKLEADKERRNALVAKYNDEKSAKSTRIENEIMNKDAIIDREEKQIEEYNTYVADATQVINDIAMGVVNLESIDFTKDLHVTATELNRVVDRTSSNYRNNLHKAVHKDDQRHGYNKEAIVDETVPEVKKEPEAKMKFEIRK